jgi:hypothetical protein
MLSMQHQRKLGRAVLAKALRPAAGGVHARGYHEKIVEHYENPRNVGSLDKTDLSVGTVR